MYSKYQGLVNEDNVIDLINEDPLAAAEIVECMLEEPGREDIEMELEIARDFIDFECDCYMAYEKYLDENL